MNHYLAYRNFNIGVLNIYEDEDERNEEFKMMKKLGGDVQDFVWTSTDISVEKVVDKLKKKWNLERVDIIEHIDQNE